MGNPKLHKLLFVGALVALLCATAYPIAQVVDAKYGQDVYLLAALNDADTVEMNRMMFDGEGLKGDAKVRAILSIYGSNPQSKLRTDRVLLFSDQGTIIPAEDKSLRFLAAGSAGGEYPTQSLSVLYVARSVSVGAFLTALLLFGAYFLLRRRVAAQPV